MKLSKLIAIFCAFLWPCLAGPTKHVGIDAKSAKAGDAVVRKFKETLTAMACQEILLLPTVRSSSEGPRLGEGKTNAWLTSSSVGLLANPKDIAKFLKELESPALITQFLECDIEYRIVPVSAKGTFKGEMPKLLLSPGTVIFRFNTEKAGIAEDWLDVAYRGEFPKWLNAMFVSSTPESPKSGPVQDPPK